jgi:creatinine amidohydrolase/Fe(II)-dependent formamide hydrolase-like protein
MSNWDFPPKGKMESESGIYLQNMTGRQLEERLKRNDIIIIPVGSTEAHGPHAPYGEDTFLVTRMSEMVAERVGCTVAQPIWYGSHPYHHIGMPGTVVVDDDVFKDYIRSVMAGLWNAGFRKQILLNGHGQEYVIPSAIHQFAKRYQVPGVFVNLNWYHAIPSQVKSKEYGGPFETPFIHADEVETSFSLALFPELIHMEDAVDTKPIGFLERQGEHVDKAGNVYQRPINWYGQVGLGPMEVYAYPEGVVGRATLAKAEKALGGLRALLDYIVELHDEILMRFPPGKLPPLEQVTQRGREEMEDIIKGPLRGGKHIYTIAYPP